jgi:alanine racemase
VAKILINKNNLFHNLEVISKQANGKEKVAIVLKDNAYGHGLIQIAKLAKEFGITKAVVRSEEEAIQIKDFFDEILILAENNMHTYSHTFHIALNTLEDIDKLPGNCNVQIKVDTGMHRNGISPNQIEDAFTGLLKKNIRITGIFTHHRSADEVSTTFYWQNSIFKDVKQNVKRICEQLNISLPIFHSCNSSALFRTKDFDEDIARVGIATYGYIENDEVFDNPLLKPVLSLWANKLSSRTLLKGQSVGYGGTYTAKENMIVSTYDVGYGDGFLRINEKQKYHTPKGFELLGRVSMDNLILNCEDDEVCIFEDVRNLSKIQNTIPYEITTTLSRNIKRIIV